MNGNDDPSAELQRLQEENLRLKLDIAKRENVALREDLSKAQTQGEPHANAAAPRPRRKLRAFLTLIGFSGRVSRISYVVGSLVALVVLVSPTVVLETIVLERGPLGQGVSAAIGMGITWVVALAALICLFSVQVRRLHDIGAPGWWVAVGASVISIGSELMNLFFEGHNVAPSKLGSLGFMTGLWVIIIAMLPGTVGTNMFGPRPRRLLLLLGDEESDAWNRGARQEPSGHAPMRCYRSVWFWFSAVLGSTLALAFDPNVHLPENSLQVDALIGRGLGIFIWMWVIAWIAWRVSRRSEAGVLGTIVTVVNLLVLANRRA